MEFLFRKPNEILNQSFQLGKKLHDLGFYPNHAISLWRGGTLIGLGINEYYRMKGKFINHTSIATSSYNDKYEQKEVIVKGLEHLTKVVVPEDKLLIIDDVFDTGETVNTLLEVMKKRCRKNMPKEIIIATLDRKPLKNKYRFNVVSLNDVKDTLWVNYPHEVSDLFINEEENYLKLKDEKAHDLLENHTMFNHTKEEIEGDYKWMTEDELFYDSIKLGMNIYNSGFEPDFLIALWPGGVKTGVYIHEVYKYLNKKYGNKRKNPDHISINTTSSHLSYKSNTIGLQYLVNNINYKDKILLIDTNFKSGVNVNSVVDKLKEGLKRNLNHKNIRIATLYFDNDAKFTWTTKPFYTEPHYYLKEIEKEVIYPHSIHKLRNPEKEVFDRDKDLYNTIWNSIHE